MRGTAKRYLFIADEKGDPGLGPGASNKLVFGGYVVAEAELSRVEKAWRQFKADICGTPDVELKSEHFFASRSKRNPLLDRNRRRRRVMAMEGFQLIYDNPSVAPLAYCVFKHRASRALIVEGRSGNPKIDVDTIWVGPFGLFAVFLTNKCATGQVWWDNVSGEQERMMRSCFSIPKRMKLFRLLIFCVGYCGRQWMGMRSFWLASSTSTVHESDVTG